MSILQNFSYFHMGFEQHEAEEMTFVWMNPLIQILQSELDHSFEVKSQFPCMKYFQHDALFVPFDLQITDVTSTRGRSQWLCLYPEMGSNTKETWTEPALFLLSCARATHWNAAVSFNSDFYFI